MLSCALDIEFSQLFRYQYSSHSFIKLLYNYEVQAHYLLSLIRAFFLAGTRISTINEEAISMSIPTTPEEWIALRAKTRQSAILQRTASQTIELRLCAVLTFLSGLLYAASFLKRRKGGMWICKKDGEGYYHPNVHTTLPIFAVLYAICRSMYFFLIFPLPWKAPPEKHS
jgi:hypothetical protein